MEKLLNDFKINFIKGDTYALAVKFKNITEDISSAKFTVKENPEDDPLVQKTLGAGISKIDDRSYKNEKTYKIQLQSEDTVDLEPLVQYLYDFRVAIGNVVQTILSGVFVVQHNISNVSTTQTSTLTVEIADTVESDVSTTPATSGIEYEQDPVACAKIGDMTTLATTNKDTLVKAINEVNSGKNAVKNNVDKIINGDIDVPFATEAGNAEKIMTKAGPYKDLATALLEMVYPVGSIKLSTENTNPSTYLGGTWEAWGSGRVPVGVAENQSEFATVEKTGGAKVAPIPYHSHNLFKGSVGSFGVDAFVGKKATDSESLLVPTTTDLEIKNPQGSAEDGFLITLSRNSEKYNADYVAQTATAGSVSATNLQPYITCYMWKRTA